MRNVIGIVVIVFGCVWLLDSLEVVNIPVWSYVLMLWPIILVYFGGAGFLQSIKPPVSVLLAVINLGLVLVGLLLIAGNYGWLDITFGDVLTIVVPVIVVLFAISLLQAPRNAFSGSTQFAVMSGLELNKQEPFEMKDQNLIAFMGGGVIDLSNAKFVKDETTLTCLAIMGGWEIRVPESVRVEFNGNMLLGGIEVFGESAGGVIAAKAIARGESGPLVRIFAQALMGGVQVKKV